MPFCQLLNLEGVAPLAGQGLLEDHVHFARGAILDDLEVAVVLDERPDDLRLRLVDHLAPVRMEGAFRRATAFRFGDRFRFGFRDSG